MLLFVFQDLLEHECRGDISFLGGELNNLVVGVPPRYQSLSSMDSACFISAMAVGLN